MPPAILLLDIQHVLPSSFLVTPTYIQPAHLRQRLYTSASMHLNRWKPTLKGMCVMTAVVRAANGTSAAAEGKVATVTHTNMAKLTTPPATIVCRRQDVQRSRRWGHVCC